VLAGLACLALALPMARRLHRRGEVLGALLVTAFCGLLISPISWTHHWVWLVPLAGLLVTRAVRTPGVATFSPIAGLAALGTGVCTMVPAGNDAELHWNVAQQLLGNAYVFGTIVVLAVLAIRLRTERPSVVELPELSRASGTPAATRG
jgi:alpha-1,2-mannosyltransferase